MQIRILVVDDEKETGDYLQLLLTKAGYEVVALTDPTLVMDRLRAEDFHLVILDMMMPQMSGTELLEKIRGYDSDIAVIVATAHPAVETAVASLKAQASDYVKKPVEPEELLAAVESALAKKGLSKDPEAELHRAIGRTIREARKSQELTLKQLARRTGLSVSLLSQIERAESSASISSLYKIASALRLRMAELFGGAVSGSANPWNPGKARPPTRLTRRWSRSTTRFPSGPLPSGWRCWRRWSSAPAWWCSTWGAAPASRCWSWRSDSGRAPGCTGWTPGRRRWTGSAEGRGLEGGERGAPPTPASSR